MTRPSSSRLLATSDLASANGAAVLRLLSSNGPLARSDLAREMRTDRGAVGPVVRRLIESGVLVEVVATEDRGVGKPKVPLWFSPDGCVAGSIAIHSTEVRLAAVNLRGQILREATFPIHAGIDGHALGVRIGAKIDVLLRPWREAVVGVGVSIPGLCEPGTGEVLASTHLPGIVGDALGLAIQSNLDLPITLEVDSRALARAESWFGIGRSVRSFVCLLTGRGLGAGIVVDRRVFSGDGRFDSEVGHMHIALVGERCVCGLIGCWETIATDSWIKREAAIAHIELDPTLPSSRALASAKGAAAEKLLGRYAEHLALGISNVIHVLGMSTVVIEGDVAELDIDFLELVSDETRKRLLPSIASRTRLLRSPLGPNAALLAGGATAIDAFLPAAL